MGTVNRMWGIVGVCLAVSCGGNAVDLGRGSSRGWADTPDEEASTTTAQSIYESYGAPDDGILGFTVDETTLYALVNHWETYELISCPFEHCQSQRTVISSGPMWSKQAYFQTKLVLVDGRLFWKVLVPERDLQGVASCSMQGCRELEIAESSPPRTDTEQSEIAGDSNYLYWIDSEMGLLRLGRDTGATPERVRSFSAGVTARRLAVAGDYVYFSDKADAMVYRARKDGTGGAEVVATDGQISALVTHDDALYYASSLLSGRIVKCKLADCASTSSSVAGNQRFSQELAVQDNLLFWLTGFTDNLREKATLRSCLLPDCEAPAERQEYLVPPLFDSTRASGHSFAVNQRFIFWNEIDAGRGSRLRRLSR